MEHATIVNPDGEIVAATADALKENGYETNIYNIKRSKDSFWEAAKNASDKELNLLSPKVRQEVETLRNVEVQSRR